MPTGKNIYSVFSKKMKDKRKRENAYAKEQAKNGHDVPATVNNFSKNKARVAKPNNVTKTPPKKRNVKEVKPIVNAKVATDGLIHKPVTKNPVQKYFPTTDGVKNGHGKATNRSRKSTKKSKPRPDSS